MTPQRWSQIKGVFNGALERPAGERAAWLRAECGTDRSAARRGREAPALPRHAGRVSRSAGRGRSRGSRARGAAGGGVGRRRPGSDLALRRPRRRVRDHPADRPRRDGRGLPGDGPPAAPQRRAQVAAGRRSPATPSCAERLKREARAAATITDPAVATVYSLEEVEGHLLLASEFLDGRTLRAVIDEGPMDAATVHAIALQVARGLRAAHEAGVVHRDLKPENIVMHAGGSGQDRGLRHRLAGRSGTHPPRQADARRRDDRHAGLHGARAAHGPAASTRAPTSTRSGVILAEMLSGRHPLSVADAAPGRARTHAGGRRARGAAAAHRRSLPPDVAGQAGAPPRASWWPRSTGWRVPWTRRRRGATAATPAAAATRFWWEFHQGAAAVSYVAMLVPAWLARGEIGGVEGRGFFIATTCAAVMAGMLRLHLWFTSRQHPAELRVGAPAVGRRGSASPTSCSSCRW